MATHYKTQGFVFKKEDWREADRVFSVFTLDFGKIEVLARAVRKITSKLRGGIDIFSLSDIEFIQGKHQKTLIDAVVIEKFSHIFQSSEEMEIANRVSGLLEMFIRGPQTDGRIWDLLADFFKKLDRQELSASRQQLLYHYFAWNFISLLGHGPQLFTCAACTKPLQLPELYFSNKEGGVICGACALLEAGVKKVHPDSIKTLRIMLKKDWDVLAKLKLAAEYQKELDGILQQYCRYLLSDYSFNRPNHEYF